MKLGEYFLVLAVATFMFLVLLTSASISQTGSSTEKLAPKPGGGIEKIICSSALQLCGCKGSDCSVLKKFASAGGCKNLRCTDDKPQICTCDLEKNEDDPGLSATKTMKLSPVPRTIRK